MSHRVNLVYPEAPGGSFEVTLAGAPSSPATVYSDFELGSTTTDRSLNASGRAGFYTPDLVDVVVYSSSGVEVDSFRDGVSAKSLIVRHPGWTGTLINGTEGVGGQISLHDILTKLQGSLDAIDGGVNISGIPGATGSGNVFLIKDAIRYELFQERPFIVANTVGDGTTDDTGAIQNAIDQAEAASPVGGVVFLRPGVFRVTTGLVISDHRVTLMGAGKNASTIQFVGASGTVLAVNCGSTANVRGGRISNLGFTVTGAGSSSSNILSITQAPGYCVDNCRFENATGDWRINVDTPTILVNSLLAMNTTSAGGKIAVSANADGTIISGCLTFASAFARAIQSAADRLLVCGNEFQTGSGAGVVVITGGSATITGNTCHSAGSGAGASILANVQADVPVIESGNHLGGAGTWIPIKLDDVTYASRIHSEGRLAQTKTLSTGATVTPVVDFSVNFQEVNGNATINAPVHEDGDPATAWNGEHLTLCLRSAASYTLTWDAVYRSTTVLPTPLNGDVAVRFVRRNTGGDPAWVREE